MIEELKRVAELQLDYSSTNTPRMQERGKLIRQYLPHAFSELLPELSSLMGATGNDLRVEGSDGIGRKTQAPWVRFFSESRSPRPTSGYYVVVHFSIDGRRIYVTIGCSSSVWDSEAGDLKRVANDELDRRILWVLQTLEDAGKSVEAFPDTISLGSEVPLPLSFERATAVAKSFPSATITRDEFITCLEEAHSLLGTIYEAFDAGKNLTESQINEAELQSAVNPALKTEAGRQGFGLSASERKAVEMRAMDVTRDHLVTLGFGVRDVSANRPYDFLASREGEELMVEVKGSTTKSLDSIMMTKNEVLLHQKHEGATALAIVSNIALDRSEGTASGGILEFLDKWSISEWGLQPMSYEVKRLRGSES